jgi:hypothetical protein
MLPKLKGVSPSALVAIKFPIFLQELRRSMEKGEKGNASMLRGNYIDIFPLFKLIYHWFSPMNVCFHA